jgi:hypothetical protein
MNAIDKQIAVNDWKKIIKGVFKKLSGIYLVAVILICAATWIAGKWIELEKEKLVCQPTEIIYRIEQCEKAITKAGLWPAK